MRGACQVLADHSQVGNGTSSPRRDYNSVSVCVDGETERQDKSQARMREYVSDLRRTSSVLVVLAALLSQGKGSDR